MAEEEAEYAGGDEDVVAAEGEEDVDEVRSAAPTLCLSLSV
jgi:hypothetical protein